MSRESSDGHVDEFVRAVTAALVEGRRFRVTGLGTFSTCARKATAERAACRIAMFRASPELREYADGGRVPSVDRPHEDAVTAIIAGMRSELGIEVSGLGRLAVVPVPGKKAKVIFHGTRELNAKLSAD